MVLLLGGRHFASLVRHCCPSSRCDREGWLSHLVPAWNTHRQGLKPFKPQQLEIMACYQNKTSNGATCSQQIIFEWFRKGNLRKESFGFEHVAYQSVTYF